MRRRTALLVTLFLFAGLVGCDHASKRAARSNLRGQQPVEVVSGVVDLQYAENPGIAFGLDRVLPASARTPVMFGAALTLLVALAIGFGRRWRSGAATEPGDPGEPADPVAPAADPPAAAAGWRRHLPDAATAGWALVAAGAAGNLLDRLVLGRVIDFIHVRHWPVFNLADAWLVVGAALIVLGARAHDRPRRGRSRAGAGR